MQFASVAPSPRRSRGVKKRLQKLLSLPGVIGKDVADMEAALRKKSNDTRTQKEAVRDLLRRATLIAVRTFAFGDLSNRSTSQKQQIDYNPRTISLLNSHINCLFAELVPLVLYCASAIGLRHRSSCEKTWTHRRSD